MESMGGRRNMDREGSYRLDNRQYYCCFSGWDFNSGGRLGQVTTGLYGLGDKAVLYGKAHKEGTIEDGKF